MHRSRGHIADTLPRISMNPFRSFRLIAIAFVLLAGTTNVAHAQFGRFGRGKPDSAQVARDSIKKAVEDSTKRANGDTATKAPSQGRFGGLMNRVMSKVVSAGASIAGDKMTTLTADLSTITPLINRNAHIYPKNVATVETNFISNWGDGGDLVTLTFTGNTGGLAKIDGTVLIDGKPADYASLGVYSAMAPGSPGARTVEISTTSGQKSSFTIPAPAGTLKIAAINGQKGVATLDLSKDVTIDLEGVGSDTTPLLIRVVATTVGLRGFYDVAYVRPAARVTVPAAAWRNVNMPVGNTTLAGFRNSYLLVLRQKYEKVQGGTGAFGYSQVLNAVSDGREIVASTEPNLNKGITVKGTQNFAVSPLDYEMFKAHAFGSRPLSQVKRVAIVSFAIRGKTYQKTTSMNAGVGSMETRTETITFPQLSNSTWDAALDGLYAALMPVVREELGPVVPIDSVTDAFAYRAMSPYSENDANTKTHFSRAYRKTKLLSPFGPVSAGYGPNQLETFLMDQTGANALLRFTLDLVISDEGGGSMAPTLGFELAGAQNGNSGSTKYFTGKITGKGLPIKGVVITPEVVEKIVRGSDLAATFRAALKDLKAKEQANPDYALLWAGR